MEVCHNPCITDTCHLVLNGWMTALGRFKLTGPYLEIALNAFIRNREVPALQRLTSMGLDTNDTKQGILYLNTARIREVLAEKDVT